MPGVYDEDKGGWSSSTAIPDLTATVGTADGTVADVGEAFDQGVLNDNFRELTAKINSVLAALRDANVIPLD